MNYISACLRTKNKENIRITFFSISNLIRISLLDEIFSLANKCK